MDHMDTERPDVRAEDLRELHKEISEAHAIATRTHNAVATLAASLKEVVTRQDKYERGLNLNSFVAYVLFTVLLGGGFFMLYRSRAGRLVVERDAAVRKRDEAVEAAAASRKELALRDDAARKATEFWQLLRDGKRADLIAKYPEIKGEHLTATEAQVFQEGVTRARNELVEQALADGLDAIKQEQWKRAITELKRGLAFEEDGPHSAQLHYYYGLALTKLGDYQEAAHQLDLAIAGGAERTVGADARYHLATALEALRQLDRARTEYNKFAEGHPNHNLYWAAKHHAAEIGARGAATKAQ
jgi:tetratricopeptide (TPR) repeat protein